MKKFKKRIRGTARQIGKPFPLLEKKKLPPRISMRRKNLGEKIKMIVGRKGKYIAVPARAEQIARMMAKKSVRNIAYHAPEEGLYDGSISFVYDGDVIRNEVKILEHEPSVASFDKHDPVVYVHRKLAEQDRKYAAIHESVEKYLKEKHGLNEYAEGHRAADEVEKRLMSPQDWARYTSVVKRIHNEEKIRSARLR